MTHLEVLEDLPRIFEHPNVRRLRSYLKSIDCNFSVLPDDGSPRLFCNTIYSRGSSLTDREKHIISLMVGATEWGSYRGYDTLRFNWSTFLIK